MGKGRRGGGGGGKRRTRSLLVCTSCVFFSVTHVWRVYNVHCPASPPLGKCLFLFTKFEGSHWIRSRQRPGMHRCIGVLCARVPASLFGYQPCLRFSEKPPLNERNLDMCSYDD